MPTVSPRHVVCLLGAWKDLDVPERIVTKVGGDGFALDRQYSRLDSDPRMKTSFEASYDRVCPTMTDADWNAVKEHAAVVYVLSPAMEPSTSLDISHRCLRVVNALLDAGGTAAKGESAGIAHGRARWAELAASASLAVGSGDLHAFRSVLYWAWVRRPLIASKESLYYSCGMHLLGQRDVEIDSGMEVLEAVKWIDLLGLYLVADTPKKPIQGGDGFRLSAGGPRRIIEFTKCARYESDSFFHNPYGYIKLNPSQ